MQFRLTVVQVVMCLTIGFKQLRLALCSYRLSIPSTKKNHSHSISYFGHFWKRPLTCRHHLTVKWVWSLDRSIVCVIWGSVILSATRVVVNALWIPGHATLQSSYCAP